MTNALIDSFKHQKKWEWLHINTHETAWNTDLCRTGERWYSVNEICRSEWELTDCPPPIFHGANSQTQHHFQWVVFLCDSWAILHSDLPRQRMHKPITGSAEPHKSAPRKPGSDPVLPWQGMRAFWSEPGESKSFVLVYWTQRQSTQEMTLGRIINFSASRCASCDTEADQVTWCQQLKGNRKAQAN